MRRNDLSDLSAFVVVADHLSFRAAARQLGVTPSALSHNMRQLEERLGMRLLNRTTRSVAVTDAGQRLLERLRPALEQITGALEDLDQERDQPHGLLRIYATHLAATAIVAPVWGRFLSSYPNVQLEIDLEDGPTDIVSKGYDIGIGRRDWVPADMIAVRVMGPMAVAVVGAPGYFERHGTPRQPEDLLHHDCVRYRSVGSGGLFEWPFERDGASHRVRVDGRVTVSCPVLALRAAIDGLGIAYTLSCLAEPSLRSGDVVRVLEDWSPSFEGLFLYYPGSRRVPAALRAFIDMVRETPTNGKSLENPFVR